MAEEGVKENDPFVLAVVVPSKEESINKETLELGSALPVIVGVELFVIAEDVAKEVGESGAVVSIVMDIDEDSEEIFPAESVDLASRE